jgi:hypothetical protein
MTRALALVLTLFPAVAIADDEKTFKGRYTWGAEVDAFQPCGSEEVFWVSASSWVQGPLIEFVKQQTNKPYQPVYIEFRGHMLNEVRDGFAESYDGLVRISEIHVKSKDIPKKCDR